MGGFLAMKEVHGQVSGPGQPAAALTAIKSRYRPQERTGLDPRQPNPKALEGHGVMIRLQTLGEVNVGLPCYTFGETNQWRYRK